MTPTFPIRLARATALFAALVALVPLASACRNRGPAPEPNSLPSPVYAWQPPFEANPENEPPPVLSHWRFVPLTPTRKPFPSDAEFLESAERCATGVANADAGDNEVPLLAKVLSCLGDRGFYPALCSDGIDNDGDGLSDFGSDPGCSEEHALSESPECDDDRDNDGDGLADWDGGGFTHPDPECIDRPAGVREAEPRNGMSFNPF